MPPLAIAVGGGHLDRRDGDALADRQVAHRRSRVLLVAQHEPLLLTGQVDAGGLAEAEVYPLAEGLAHLRPIVTDPTFEDWADISDAE
jgi:hypothetical protein